MKQNKTSHLIHLWEDFEFYLNIPQALIGSNKPFIFYYYLNTKTNKRIRIRKYISRCNGDIKQIKALAKQTITEIVKLLSNDWNPITNIQNEATINSTSTITECIDYWLNKREIASKETAIKAKTLKGNKILMMHFCSYLNKNSLANIKATHIHVMHIKEFMEHKTFERNWGKVTYNTYLVDLRTFFNYLKEIKIIKDNPCDRVQKKNIKFDSTRFKVFEKEELKQVSNLLANDHRYFGLYVSTKLLFKYNIRPLEMTRLQILDIDFKERTLNLPYHKTKNGNEARFKLDEETYRLLEQLTTNYPIEWFVFGGRNKPSPIQVCPDYFGQNWRFFKNRYKLPKHLKLYALKHTSNYYDIQDGASFEEIRQRNRHANLQVTTLYVKERLFKNVIVPSSNKLF